MPEQAAEKNQDYAVSSDLLHNGTAQVGGMVTTITLVGQAFTNLDIHYAVAPLAAFTFAALLAVYQVSIVQKAPRQSCYILVPIATLILFALAYAGNNSLAPDPETAALQDELDLARQELQLKEKNLASSNALIAQFQQTLGLKGNDGGDNQTLLMRKPETNRQWSFADWLVSPAIAQDDRQPEPENIRQQQQELSEALKNYKLQQQTLQKEQQRLEQQRRKDQQQQPRPSVWRRWR